MEDWIVASKGATTSRERQPSKTTIELHDLLSGRHHWQATSHARPTYCNVCRDALSGVTSHGLSCEICKWKVHKRCASKAINNCKWTTLASVRKEIIEDKDGNIYMSHQWMEGNLPVSSKCAVCEKNCGSVLRLQDWRCLWCRATVHTACRPLYPVRCDLGPNRVSIVPPTALHSVGKCSDEAWEAVRPQGCSPLLVFVNSKSGDNQGVKFLKRFKQLLNPAQVFDLIPSGPFLGLKLFRRFDPFRVLVCSGDGSVGWVLSEIDKINITNQCQVGVLPLGTGNDLARVLGWGASCDDDANLSHLLDKYEKATTKMLDRWSIMTFERSLSLPNEEKSSFSSFLPAMAACENSVVFHLSNILESNEHPSIIASAKVLCETVKQFITRAVEISLSQGDDELNKKCIVIREKLDQLLNTLHEEGLELEEDGFEKHSLEKSEKDEKQFPSIEDKNKLDHLKLTTQEKLKMRANSLKRAVRQLIEHSEKVIDEQNIPREADTIIIDSLDPQPYKQNDRAELISPLPTLRRDSNCSTSDVLTLDLPVPTQFADSRRSSASRISSPFHGLTRSETMEGQSTNPRVIIEPPSPSGEDTPTRRFSYDCCRKLSAASPCSMIKSDSPDTVKPIVEKKLPIINPLVRLPTWPNISGPGLVSKVLLANADALCAAAVPLMDPQETLLEGFREKCVMNNYFGIGIDAKITLDFHQKREEHPEKCRSRAKNYMWYGVLGSKEWLQKTYKNLEQRVQLECDGQRIPLPSLQGIVILNIPSFMGGTNFWGGTKEGEVFLAPSVDDQVLEVVAVFGSVQMAASRLINLQHHRIAQCHTVQINITGDEGVPIQVDGEAWVQPPGMIRIIHKNRMRMLCRNRALETSLKSWQEKQGKGKLRAPLPHSLSQSEMQMLISFIEATTTLVKCVKVLIIKNPSIEAEVYELADKTASNLEKVHPSGKIQQGPELRLLLTSLVKSAKELHEGACLLLKEKSNSFEMESELETQLSNAITNMEGELRKCHISECGQSLVYLQQPPDVSSWLESLQLGEYCEAFTRHDLRGREVMTLTRRDLKELGVTKVGHVKRLLHAAKDLKDHQASYGSG
ncbi:unnamed protein product [Nezara viridula]|uniref:Diacylglycerol kinase n=1 Tax=Nezara viridula TaxID=85310 RepID=A0A9P0HBC2_NEZVI|nr:unnamed protein product [Nezara viridula]